MSRPNEQQPPLVTVGETAGQAITVYAQPADESERYWIGTIPDGGNGEFSIRAGRLGTFLSNTSKQDQVVFQLNPPPTLELADGRIIVDQEKHMVTVDGAPQSFSPTMFGVLGALAREPDTVLSTAWIAKAVWPDMADPEKRHDIVQTAISRVRASLGPELGPAIHAYPLGYSGLSTLLSEQVVAEESVFPFADNRVQVNVETGAILVDGSMQSLGSVSRRILLTLAKEPDTIITLGRIAREVWPEDPQQWVDGSGGVSTARQRIHVQVARIRKILGPELRRAIYTGSNPFGYGVLSRLPVIEIQEEGAAETREPDKSASSQQPEALSVGQTGSPFGITVGALLKLIENGRVQSTDRVILASELGSFRRFASDEETTETTSVWLANSRIEIQPDRQFVFTYNTAFPPLRTQLALTETQYKIFAFLSEHREPVQSRLLIEYLWPDSDMPYKNLYTNLCNLIKRIRNKLPEDLRGELKNQNRRGYYFSD